MSGHTEIAQESECTENVLFEIDSQKMSKGVCNCDKQDVICKEGKNMFNNRTLNGVLSSTRSSCCCCCNTSNKLPTDKSCYKCAANLNAQYLNNSLSTIIDTESLKILVLEKCKLTVLPKNLSGLKNLKILDLQHNSLKTLPVSCKYLNKLLKLDLSYNCFMEAPECIAEGWMGALHTLNFSNNNLNMFRVKPKALQLLAFLNLSNNRLNSVPLWLVQNGFSTLEHLDLSNNSVDILSNITPNDTLCNIMYMRNSIAKTLKSITLKCCSLSNMNLSIISTFNVNVLNLSNCDGIYCNGSRNFLNGASLLELPNVANLTELYLSNVHLVELRTDIKKFTKLQVLDVSHNEIIVLPTELCFLVDLRVLKVSDNCLMKLPDNIGNLNKLRKLFLSNNEIFELPCSMIQLKELEILDLYNNCLKSVPDVISSLNLKGLDLDCNYISIEVTGTQIDLEVENYSDLRSVLRKAHKVEDQRSIGPRRLYDSDDGLDEDDVIDEDDGRHSDITSSDDEDDFKGNENECNSVPTSEKWTDDSPEENWDIQSAIDDNFSPYIRSSKIVVAVPRIKYNVGDTVNRYTPSDTHTSSIYMSKKMKRVSFL